LAVVTEIGSGIGTATEGCSGRGPGSGAGAASAARAEVARRGERRRWLDRALHLLLPAPCLGCGEPLPARVPPLALCVPCRGALAPPRRPACAVCAAALEAAAPPAGFACGRCRARPPAFDRLLAAWRYAPPLDAVIRALKFGRRGDLGAGLAAEMAERLGGELERLAGGPPELVVPVPLHWRRRLGRGYNQAERIARPLARRLGLPFAAALARRRATAPQTALGGAARRANPRGAFAAAAARVAGRRVLLVDDVATTGATLDAAAACLRAAGAAAVVAAAAALRPSREAAAGGFAATPASRRHEGK
jgi:ComF family protein